jgi:predicted nucleic acid-binding protein
MAYRLDTGILLRLVDHTDSQHSIVFDAVNALIHRQDNLFITIQNIAEFCNVATRPIINNGLGLAPTTAIELLNREIEPICAIIPEQVTLTAEFKRRLTQYNVLGKQVHDARLVAMMLIWQISHVLTLNERNFQRFSPEGIIVVSPASLIAANP